MELSYSVIFSLTLRDLLTEVFSQRPPHRGLLSETSSQRSSLRDTDRGLLSETYSSVSEHCSDWPAGDPALIIGV
jgi:hypothetical protein